MENEHKKPVDCRCAGSTHRYLLPLGIILASVIISATWVYVGAPQKAPSQDVGRKAALASIERVTPGKGVMLPVTWNDLGAKLVESGVIDKEKFEALYEERGGLTEADRKLAFGDGNGNLVITKENSGLLLNLLWGLGLANKNEILEKGPMTDKRFGGADKFASTGGWIFAKGKMMDHYSMHPLVTLTPEQQEKAARVAKGIYRPCCDNPTHFPDCNHGMAMLGLIELMASQGLSEDEMYKAALAVNSYWFPQHYELLATFFDSNGIAWDKVNPKDVLGANFSSASAAAQIAKAMNPVERKGGGPSCGA